MKKEILSVYFSFLFVCYILISGYVFFAFARINVAGKLWTGIFFEALGIFFVFVVKIIAGFRNMKTGYLVPIVICTALYTLFMNALNIWGSIYLTITWFVLAHIIWAIVYIAVVIPMYIMGKQ